MTEIISRSGMHGLEEPQVFATAGSRVEDPEVPRKRDAGCINAQKAKLSGEPKIQRIFKLTRRRFL